jgi:TRAP-type C4-dicarboxylate transport system permease small subunit
MKRPLINEILKKNLFSFSRGGRTINKYKILLRLILKIDKGFDRVIEFLARLGAALIVFITFGVLIEVFLRYFFGRPIIWMVEVTEYCLLYIPFLSAAWLLKKDLHIRVDLVLSWLNPRAQALINFITSILGAIICLALVKYGVGVTWDYFRSGYFYPTPLRTPGFLILAIIPAGSFFLLIQFLKETYEYLRSLRALQHQRKK